MTKGKNNSLFKPNTKNLFLAEVSEVNDGTARSYARIFGKTQEIEEEKNKDINQFTLEELEEILYGFKANNRNTIESYGRIISSYLNWSVREGIIKKNVLADLKPSDFEKYLTNEEVYFTENQLRRYEDRCTNYQDAVIIELLFIGVSGKQMSEIRNLKAEHIDFNNKTIKLINTLTPDEDGLPINFTERTLTNIEDHTLELLRGAIDQKIYTKSNGDMEAYDNIRPYTDLVDNEYVVRPSITKTERWHNPVDKFVIYRRLQTIADSVGIDELTAKYIQRSGMIFMANKLIRDEELSLDHLKMVADRFNMKSYHNLKGFLSVENIRKTYPKK